MRILYFTHFYAPENIAAAFRARDHAVTWAEAGHEVTVFTGWPSYPAGRLFDGYKMESLREETVEGVRVFRSRSRIQPNTSFRKRIESGASFVLNGLKNLRGGSPVGEDYDVVLATSGTVFAAWLGARFAKRHGIPLVVEFRDLTYRQMVATGSSERSAKVRVMKALELSLCKAAGHVVVLTEGFKEELALDGVSRDKVTVVPNGADVVPCEHAWSSCFRLGYFGTMGLSQDVPTTIEYVSDLAKRGLAQSYLLIGEGAARSMVEGAAASCLDGFVTLMHGMPKDELEAHYASVDMTVVSLQKTGDFSGTVPSKIFQSFARGTPVLFVGPEGEASHLIRKSGGGMALCGTRDEDMDSLVEFASRPDLPEALEAMSVAAIKFMEEGYTRKRMAERMIRVFERVARQRN